jgi:hypothetical protein
MKKASRQSREERPRGYTVGRSAFARISAVEGIRLTDEMHRDFSEFDREGLSDKDRRKAIAKKYAKTR